MRHRPPSTFTLIFIKKVCLQKNQFDFLGLKSNKVVEGLTITTVYIITTRTKIQKCFHHFSKMKCISDFSCLFDFQSIKP